ncbi:MAG: hypothetical protein ACR2JU_14505 [Nocardioidaceae bacterium]
MSSSPRQPEYEQESPNETQAERSKRMLSNLDRSAAYFQACDLAALEEIAARPVDWTVPEGENYNCPGPAWADAACGIDCVPERCVGSAHRVIGVWRPDKANTAWHFLPQGVPGESEEHRLHRLTVEMSTPAMRRATRDNKLLAAFVADDDKKPVASIFCSAESADGRRCRRRIANLYLVDATYVIADANSYTFHEARTAHLNAALHARDLGHVDWAAAHEASANVKEWPIIQTLDRRSKDDVLARPGGLPFDYLIVGCQHHGNLAMSCAWLRSVGRAGEDMEVDPQSRRWCMLKSEAPTAD